MSYARKNDESDVYVYLSGENTYHCQQCMLRGDGENYTTKKIAQMYSHLTFHIWSGHKVPQTARDRLYCEMMGLDPEKKLQLV